MDKSLPKSLRKQLKRDVPGQTTNTLYNAVARNYVLAHRARKLLISSGQLDEEEVIALELWWVSKLSKAVAGTLTFFTAVSLIMFSGLFPKGEATFVAVMRLGALILFLFVTYFVSKETSSLFLRQRTLPAMREKYLRPSQEE